VLDEKIDLIADIKCHAVVRQRQRDLRIGIEAALAKLVQQTGFLRGFEQPRAECRVNLDCRVDDLPTDLVVFHPPRSSVSSVVDWDLSEPALVVFYHRGHGGSQRAARR
jgi:hypothetical protein